MNKELNPELFGEKRVTKPETGGLGATSLHSAGLHSNSASVDAGFLNLDRQVFELKSAFNQMNEQFKKLTQQMLEHSKSSNLKLERLQQSLGRLEQSHNGLALEAGQKISSMNQKFQERKALDAKIQEMVDRHNNVVKSFEVRMNQLQKLLVDKEAQVVAAQAAINETKMEIARLKRL